MLVCGIGSQVAGAGKAEHRVRPPLQRAAVAAASGAIPKDKGGVLERRCHLRP